MKHLAVIGFFAALISIGGLAHAEETTGEKVKATTEDVKNSTKEAYRNAKGELCEMVKGKMECAKEGVMNKGRNVKDKVSSEAKKAKNKVD